MPEVSKIHVHSGSSAFRVLCAVLCGLDDLESLHVFAESNRSLWAERLGLTRIPSKSTFGRILSIVDADVVGKAMAEILQERFGTNGNVAAVDGKAVCGTGKDGQPRFALQILTAYMTENGVILGQESIHEKTNEIPVFQQMPDYLYSRCDALSKGNLRENCLQRGEFCVGP